MEKTEEEFDFLVVGAGIVGLAISKDLLEKGFSVLTIEKIIELAKKPPAEIQALFIQEFIILQIH